MANKGMVFVTGGSGFVGRTLIPYLARKGYGVKALARSDASSKIVVDLGAEVVRGDLDDLEALRKGCEGVDHVLHCAAKVDLEGHLDDFRRITVQGAVRTLKAAQAANAQSFVLVSSEQAILGGPTIVNADETWPYPESPLGPYAITKGEAERECIRLSQNEDGSMEGPTRVMVVRPRLIWGQGDSTVLPAMVEAVRSGQWKWIGGGRHLTSTINVLNCCAGMVAAMEKGKNGEIYFLTDGEYIEFRAFMTRLIQTRGVDASQCGSIPFFLGRIAGFFNILPAPVVRLFGETCTVSDKKARDELGYENEVTIEEGFHMLESEHDEEEKGENDAEKDAPAGVDGRKSGEEKDVVEAVDGKNEDGSDGEKRG